VEEPGGWVVGQQAEREVVVLREGEVVLDRVEGGSEDLYAPVSELLGSVTEPDPFDCSTGGRGLRVPPEHDPASGEVAEPDGLAILVGKLEARSGVAFLHVEIVAYSRRPAIGSRVKLIGVV